MGRFAAKTVLAITACALLAFANTPDGGSSVDIPDSEWLEGAQAEIVNTAYDSPPINFPAPELWRKAQAGDAEAQVEVGKKYRFAAKGLPADYFAAYEWFRKAERQGNAEAMYQIGNMHSEGAIGPKELRYLVQNMPIDRWLSVDVDYAKTLEWYKKAADKNHTGAQMAIAGIYGMGYQNWQHVQPNVSETLKWYQIAVDNGSAAAVSALFSIYHNGWDNVDERGNVYSIVRSNKGETEKWYNKAKEMYVKATEDKDHSAISILGDVLLDGNKVQLGSVVPLIRNAAEQNIPWAQYQLGKAYGLGKGVKKNKIEAEKYIRMAAENGTAQLQYEAARIYALNRYVKLNKNETERLLRKAADNGDAVMQYNVAVAFGNGRINADGFSQLLNRKDAYEAAKYFRMAAENGDATLHYMVGRTSYQQIRGYGSIEEHGDINVRLYGPNYTSYNLDFAESFKWFHKVATEGRSMWTPNNNSTWIGKWYFNACQLLGYMYHEGQGTPKNEDEAKKWIVSSRTTRWPTKEDIAEHFAEFSNFHLAILSDWNARWKEINPQ